jgi:uncharacterized protein YifE (UPF0438 family)
MDKPPDLTPEEEALVKRHLLRYERLASGQSQPASENERSFVQFFRPIEPMLSDTPRTPHEVAYRKCRDLEFWKASQVAAAERRAHEEQERRRRLNSYQDRLNDYYDR